MITTIVSAGAEVDCWGVTNVYIISVTSYTYHLSPSLVPSCLSRLWNNISSTVVYCGNARSRQSRRSKSYLPSMVDRASALRNGRYLFDACHGAERAFKPVLRCVKTSNEQGEVGSADSSTVQRTTHNTIGRLNDSCLRVRQTDSHGGSRATSNRFFSPTPRRGQLNYALNQCGGRGGRSFNYTAPFTSPYSINGGSRTRIRSLARDLRRWNRPASVWV